MRSKAVIICLLALFLVGCSSNNKGKIEGTKWSSKKTEMDGIELPAGALTLEFSEDGSLAYTAGPEVYKGKYTLMPGDSVKFVLDKELGGRKDHVEKIVVTGDELTMTDSDKTSLTFTKVK